MIMAGGKGTRFWPLSHKVRAKQFLALLGETSLLSQTIDRIEDYCPLSHRWVLGNVAQKEYLVNLTDRVPSQQILQEPKGMNTAACIGWAAFELMKKDSDAVMAILPSDQWVGDHVLFHQTIQVAVQEAYHNKTIVTVGIVPTEPHTGFGYIQSDSTEFSVKHVRQFVEKPTLDVATQYLESGHFYWNAGMFVCRADVMVSLFQQYLPHHYEVLSQPREKVLADYHTLESISIDYGIMEKVPEHIRLIPSAFDWSDIGNWRAIESFLKKDSNGNAVKGEFVSVDSSNNIIYAEPGRLVALADVSNMIVVSTNDAVMILPKDSDQKIKELYSQLDPYYQ